MTRRLLNLLTALSLLVCVAAAAMWVRSYFVEDVVSREYARDEGPGVYVTGTTYVASSCGGIALVRGRTVFGGDPARVRDLVDGLRRRHKLASVNGWSRSRSAPYGYPVGEGSHTLGFAWVRDHSDQSLQEPDGTTMRFQAWNRTAAGPYWFLTAATGWPLAPVALAARRRIRRRHRSRAQLCPACGYDLRATPGRCPECGTVAASG